MKFEVEKFLPSFSHVKCLSKHTHIYIYIIYIESYNFSSEIFWICDMYIYSKKKFVYGWLCKKKKNSLIKKAKKLISKMYWLHKIKIMAVDRRNLWRCFLIIFICSTLFFWQCSYTKISLSLSRSFSLSFALDTKHNGTMLHLTQINMCIYWKDLSWKMKRIHSWLKDAFPIKPNINLPF